VYARKKRGLAKMNYGSSAKAVATSLKEQLKLLSNEAFVLVVIQAQAFVKALLGKIEVETFSSVSVFTFHFGVLSNQVMAEIQIPAQTRSVFPSR